MQDRRRQDRGGRDGGRRRFVWVAALGLAAVSAVGMGLAGLRAAFFRPRRRRLFAVGPLADFAPGRWRRLSAAPVYVIASESGLAALSARCTHLGCTLGRNERGFACPCHGSRFGPSGQVLSPPARQDLPWYELRVVDGQVLVDLDRPVRAGTRLSWESLDA